MFSAIEKKDLRTARGSRWFFRLPHDAASRAARGELARSL
jgi:hypothetical protein